MLLLALVLALAVVCLCATAASSEPVRTGKEFLIGSWSVIPPNYTNDENYARMAAAGFNLVVGTNDRGEANPGHYLKVLDLCQRYGMKCIIRDNRIHFDPQTDEDKAALDDMIALYRNHPALYGYFILDEPNPEKYRRLIQVHAYLAEKDPEHVPYINLFPMYGGPHQLEFDNYDQYVQEFVRLVKPFFISYDHYNFKREGERLDFFHNLEIARREALKADIPLWFILQALQDATRYRPPTLNQMYWQVSSALAYGTKAIFYFPYWSSGDPDKPEEWHYIGLILPDATPAPRYEMAKEINPQIKRLGTLLMKLTSISVSHLGTLPRGCKKFEADDLIAEASGDQIIIGRLNDDENKPVLILANRDWDGSGNVSIKLTKGTDVSDSGRIGPGNPLSSVKWDATTKTFSITLAPGEARVVRIVE